MKKTQITDTVLKHTELMYSNKQNDLTKTQQNG